MTQDVGGTRGDMVVGGYVVVLPTTPHPASGLPDTIVTVSHCQTDAPSHELFGWFTDAEEAAAACVGTPGARVASVGIDRRDTGWFLQQYGGPEAELFDVLREMQPFPGGGVLLGHEVVGVGAIFFVHSWHCHDYAGWVQDELGVTVNALGLVAGHGDAERVRDWMLALPLEHQPAPVTWIVVGIAVPAGDVLAASVA